MDVIGDGDEQTLQAILGEFPSFLSSFLAYLHSSFAFCVSRKRRALSVFTSLVPVGSCVCTTASEFRACRVTVLDPSKRGSLVAIGADQNRRVSAMTATECREFDTDTVIAYPA